MNKETPSFRNQEIEGNHLQQQLIISKLSERQLEIIKLASGSLTNKEIASQLIRSEATIKKTRENIYKTLNINGKEEVRLFLRWVKANL